MAASGTLISGVKSGSLRGGNKQRNQIQLYKRVSHSCLVKTPHLPAPLQVNNQGRVSSAGPWHTFSPHPLSIESGSYSSGFHVGTLDATIFFVIK